MIRRTRSWSRRTHWEKKLVKKFSKDYSRFALGLVTFESIPTIPFCCFPIVSVFQLEGYSKEYLNRRLQRNRKEREGEERRKKKEESEFFVFCFLRGRVF